MEPMFPDLVPAPATPPVAFAVSGRWIDGEGWTLTAAARYFGCPGWTYASLEAGSALTYDELIDVATALLLRAGIDRGRSF